MKLEDFLTAVGRSRAEFAREIGVSEVAVTRYIGGKRTPRADVLARIASVTKGAVTPNDFFPVTAFREAQPEAAR